MNKAILICLCKVYKEYYQRNNKDSHSKKNKLFDEVLLIISQLKFYFKKQLSY